MYYSSGNYEAFARPEKPEGVDHKSAYLIGSGLAALSAACFMVRDGQMKGEHIIGRGRTPTPGVASVAKKGPEDPPPDPKHLRTTPNPASAWKKKKKKQVQQ